jgi:hypothetical protein
LVVLLKRFGKVVTPVLTGRDKVEVIDLRWRDRRFE